MIFQGSAIECGMYICCLEGFKGKVEYLTKHIIYTFVLRVRVCYLFVCHLGEHVLSCIPRGMIGQSETSKVISRNLYF